MNKSKKYNDLIDAILDVVNDHCQGKITIAEIIGVFDCCKDIVKETAYDLSELSRLHKKYPDYSYPPSEGVDSDP